MLARATRCQALGDTNGKAHIHMCICEHLKRGKKKSVSLLYFFTPHVASEKNTGRTPVKPGLASLDPTIYFYGPFFAGRLKSNPGHVDSSAAGKIVQNVEKLFEFDREN